MMALLKLALAAPLLLGSQAAHLFAQPSPAKPSLRAGANVTYVNASAPVAGIQHQRKQPPCQCEKTNPAWARPARTTPKCIFIDLGAADGNTFNSFLNNGYGAVANCPNNGDWSAILVEANPRFNPQLTQLQTQWGPQKVQALGAHAAYSCEATTSFYLDTVTHEHNYWGSSMSSDAPDVQAGKQQVTVPTVNLNRLLAENSIPGDYVLVKMDIEGAEWDVLPCVADSQESSLMDALYVEVHGMNLGLIGTTQAGMDAAMNTLRGKGVNIPNYFSNTL